MVESSTPSHGCSPLALDLAHLAPLDLTQLHLDPLDSGAQSAPTPQCMAPDASQSPEKMMPECARSPACLRATADATVEGRFALAWQDRERFVATMKKDWMPDSIAPPKPSYNGVRDELAFDFSPCHIHQQC